MGLFSKKAPTKPAPAPTKSNCPHTGGYDAGWHDETTWVKHCHDCGGLMEQRKAKAPAGWNQRDSIDDAADRAHEALFDERGW